MSLHFWLKSAGLSCVFFACMAYGWEKERCMKLRWQLFLELKNAFAVLEKEMIFHHTTTADALRSAASGLESCLFGVFVRAAEAVEEGNGETFQWIWNHAVEQEIPDGMLRESEKRMLYRAAPALCGTDPVMQRTLLLQNQEQFGRFSETAEREYHEKGALIRRLSAALGAFLVIVLI